MLLTICSSALASLVAPSSALTSFAPFGACAINPMASPPAATLKGSLTSTFLRNLALSLLINAKSVFHELVAETLPVLVPILNPPDEAPPSVYDGLAIVAYHFPPKSEL